MRIDDFGGGSGVSIDAHFRRIVIMEDIKSYVESLINKYGSSVYMCNPNVDNGEAGIIPGALKELYGFMSKASLPFGEIFSVEEALRQSERNPFKPDWFVFGKDRYFSFWLCLYNPDDEGLSFTSWDHDSGNEIDGAVWTDVISFLKDMEQEYEEV
ncbi:MAG TPA: hypothetical protein PKK43_01175 [Spirochaetota bacterium]|nr:hypothetical protein [Spirochaetota bacterium]